MTRKGQPPILTRVQGLTSPVSEPNCSETFTKKISPRTENAVKFSKPGIEQCSSSSDYGEPRRVADPERQCGGPVDGEVRVPSTNPKRPRH